MIPAQDDTVKLTWSCNAPCIPGDQEQEIDTKRDNATLPANEVSHFGIVVSVDLLRR